MQSNQVRVQIDLNRVRENAVRIRRETNVPLRAVIKADAYGLGAREVAVALADIADEFCYFTLEEARIVGRPGLCLGPPTGTPEEYAALRVRPSIATREDAARFASIPVAINFDTGMNRFGCDAETLAALLKYKNVVDVWTHAATVADAATLRDATRDHDVVRHASCSNLLDEPAAQLDGVRPGIALYRGAVTVTTKLIVARSSNRPAGYTQFRAPHFGVIPLGYANGLRPAPVIINNQPQQLLEIGMNTAFVSLAANDRVHDEVTLLGNGLTEVQLAANNNTREHEILCRYCAMGIRETVGQ